VFPAASSNLTVAESTPAVPSASEILGLETVTFATLPRITKLLVPTTTPPYRIVTVVDNAAPATG